MSEQQSDGWISVEERLPERYKSVLCCDTTGISSDEREPIVGFLDDDGWYQPWSDKELFVTHWQQLPQPPVIKEK